MPIVKVNGADPGGLIEWHENENVRSPEFKITWYAGILVVLVITLAGVSKLLNIPWYAVVPVTVVMLIAFLLVVVAASGKGINAFEKILAEYFSGKRKSRYRRNPQRTVSQREGNPDPQVLPRNSGGE